MINEVNEWPGVLSPGQVASYWLELQRGLVGVRVMKQDGARGRARTLLSGPEFESMWITTSEQWAIYRRDGDLLLVERRIEANLKATGLGQGRCRRSELVHDGRS